ncbi:MAG: precorrin-6A reductase [Bacillota bacterium]
MVLYGTSESRDLIGALKKEGFGVVAVVRTDYGGRLAGVSGADWVVSAPADAGGMAALINNFSVKQLIDATHPFANPLSAMARDTCASEKILYIRYGRGETDLPANPLIRRVYSWEEAAEAASVFEDTVFLTTGSNNLETFLQHPALKGRRIVVRVLPDYRVIKKCQDLGISPRDMVAMQGPFSVKLNKAIFQAYKTGVMVTRDGGPAGGTYNKVRAAAELKIPVVLMQREKMSVPDLHESLEQLVQKVKNNAAGMAKGRDSF